MNFEPGPLWFDRQGRPIDINEWNKLQEDDPEYKRIAYDEIGHYRISTIWMGLNHNWLKGPPIIFETMIFDRDKQTVVELSSGTHTYDEEVEMWRYPTEEAALAGHDQAVMWARERIKSDAV